MSVILSGVLVFLVGEIIVRFLLGPLHRLKEVKGEIASTLLFHANNYGRLYQNLDHAIADPGEEQRAINERIESAKMWNSDLSKASDETRSMAAKLISAAESVPFYGLLSRCKAVPPKNSILQAKRHLIELSNSFAPGQFEACVESSKNIYKLLGIQFFEE